MSNLDEKAKIKLAKLVKTIEHIVDAELKEFSISEINHVLEKYKKFLSYDLGRDFQKAQTQNLKESPFDDLLDNT